MSYSKWAIPSVRVNVDKEGICPDETKTRVDPSINAAQFKYRQSRVQHWNEVARKPQTWRGWGSFYHCRLTEIYQSLVSPGQSVLELGCARGDLLAALKPASGFGVDFSGEMIQRQVSGIPTSVSFRLMYMSWNCGRNLMS